MSDKQTAETPHAECPDCETLWWDAAAYQEHQREDHRQ